LSVSSLPLFFPSLHPDDPSAINGKAAGRHTPFRFLFPLTSLT
jgi:hypothetical protein